MLTCFLKVNVIKRGDFFSKSNFYVGNLNFNCTKMNKGCYKTTFVTALKVKIKILIFYTKS